MELRQEGGGSGRWVYCWLALLPPFPQLCVWDLKFLSSIYANPGPPASLPFPSHMDILFFHSPFSLYSLCLSLFASLVGPCMNRPTYGIKHLNKKADPLKCITFSSSSLALLPGSEVETPLSFCVSFPSAQRGCCVYNNPINLQG